ncbi:MAG TPA: ABC transporter ATP-binding protein [Proteobacteria bacterium]|nr:ABC transporter ATP-binding protein [Pseudomonadota bacterium]
MLQIRELSKSFDGIEAVKEFDLDLAPGKITALIGPNGAGKTTLFNLVTGFVSPTRGRILWKEQNTTGMPSHVIARLGISRTFQEVKLFRSLTVAENLLMAKRKGTYEGLWAALVRRAAFKNQARQHRRDCEKSLQAVMLSDKADLPASALSYGQGKLLEILKAVATDPQLLLLDEPVAGLNPIMINTIRTFVTDLAKRNGITVLLIEHNIPFVLEIADWVVVMDHGIKIAEGIPEDIKKNSKVVKAYLG